jgi:hypothetical protein
LKKKAFNASKPPADAPNPVIGKILSIDSFRVAPVTSPPGTADSASFLYQSGQETGERKKKTAQKPPLDSAHPQMANFPDICVNRKILSSEYQPYACGKIFRKP